MRDITETILAPGREPITAYMQVLEQDLQLASAVQSSLLPESYPKHARIDLGAHCAPARLIGGDFYDFVHYPGKSLSAGALADVAGKGAAAAIYAALVMGLMRSLEKHELGPAEMLTALNSALLSRPVEGHFVSALYATWDDATRTFYLSNSGLPFPIWVRDGEVIPVEIAGPPLGLFEGMRYEETALACRPGDLVVFFTDGVTDATNRAGEDFGRARLERLVGHANHLTAAQIVRSIFTATRRHAGGGEVFDDQTVIAIRT